MQTNSVQHVQERVTKKAILFAMLCMLCYAYNMYVSIVIETSTFRRKCATVM